MNNYKKYDSEDSPDWDEAKNNLLFDSNYLESNEIVWPFKNSKHAKEYGFIRDKSKQRSYFIFISEEVEDAAQELSGYNRAFRDLEMLFSLEYGPDHLDSLDALLEGCKGAIKELLKMENDDYTTSKHPRLQVDKVTDDLTVFINNLEYLFEYSRITESILFLESR
jgi:hypothetical protein